MAFTIQAIKLAISGEVLDMRDDLATMGYWRWRASLHDVLNTLFWPTVLMVLVRFGIVFRREPPVLDPSLLSGLQTRQ